MRKNFFSFVSILFCSLMMISCSAEGGNKPLELVKKLLGKETFPSELTEPAGDSPEAPSASDSSMGIFTFEFDTRRELTVSEQVGNHLIELVIDPVNNLHFNLFFDGIYYDLYDAPHGPGENSTIFWVSGQAKRIPSEDSRLSMPVVLIIEVIRESGFNKFVRVNVLKNLEYNFQYNIAEYTGDYYNNSGDKYTFYMRGQDLYFRWAYDSSPYLKSGKLEKIGYRQYLRKTYSAMGEVWTTFTFNKSPNNQFNWGRQVVNVISDGVDYPSEGMLLYKR